MSHHRKRRLLAAVLLACVPLTGCVLTDKSHTAAKPKTSASKPAVQVDPGAKAVGLGDCSTLAAEAFVAKVRQLLDDAKTEATQRYCARFPDLMLESLRTATEANAASAALLAIAAQYDDMCATAEPEAGWQALLQDRAKRPKRYADYFKLRAQWTQLMKAGNHAEAAALPLLDRVPANPVPVLLRIDALQLTGTALSLGEKPVEAVAAFRQAVELAKPYPHHASYLLLQEGDALRRANQAAGADACWEQATTTAVGQLNHSVADPSFWDRAAVQRPTTLAWPNAVCQEAARYGRVSEEAGEGTDGIAVASFKPDGNGTGEVAVWTSVGRAHLQRGEPRLALVAFKRAEAWAAGNHQRDELQLLEAEALAQLKQTTAALAILSGLSKKPERISCPALAMVGSLRLQAGSVQQGLLILRRAVEEHEGFDWPDRGEAEANLGLAYLMANDEASGLRWLHAAERRFEADGDIASLRQALENEANFLEQADKHLEASEVRKRLKLLDNGTAAEKPHAPWKARR